MLGVRIRHRQKWLQSVMRTGILNTHKINTWKWHIAAKRKDLRYASAKSLQCGRKKQSRLRMRGRKRLQYTRGHNEVRWRPGQKTNSAPPWSKFGAPMVKSEFFRRQIYCIEDSRGRWGTVGLGAQSSFLIYSKSCRRWTLKFPWWFSLIQP